MGSNSAFQWTNCKCDGGGRGESGGIHTCQILFPIFLPALHPGYSQIFTSCTADVGPRISIGHQGPMQT